MGTAGGRTTRMSGLQTGGGRYQKAHMMHACPSAVACTKIIWPAIGSVSRHTGQPCRPGDPKTSTRTSNKQKYDSTSPRLSISINICIHSHNHKHTQQINMNSNMITLTIMTIVIMIILSVFILIGKDHCNDVLTTTMKDNSHDRMKGTEDKSNWAH